ncbi:MAG: RagB/SusD family nutrient uptake outer membrane protein [Bacteroidota bacterium]|nr:RagB/SusD family nutrient uptake outer membrane protein [Bacteroidota bacterium]
MIMIKRRIFYIVFAGLCATLALTSCTDYLNKAPEAGLTEDDIFKSFDKFQGFIEEGYWCMEDPMTSFSSSIFNFGDDIYMPRAQFMGSTNSDYRSWETSQECIFYANGTKYVPYSNPGSNSDGYSNVGYWDGGWLGIRKANIALENLDKLVIPYKGAPLQEQKDLIEGQALFLRAYLYFHIIRVWGGMPYITDKLMPADNLKFPRLNYAQTSDMIEKDLLRAAELLPADWDQTATGQITSGNNSGRFTKGAAYALLGKVMLYAGSPLMNGESTGNYTYNKEYCKKAVKYFGEVLKLSAITGGTIYDLVPWEDYRTNFVAYQNIIPCSGKEGVLSPPIQSHLRVPQIGDFLNSMGGWGLGCGPLENYVQYFGMNNGENFDPSVYNSPSINPWANRDPRFYIDIVTDGSTLMYNASSATKANPAQFYLGGRDRNGNGNTDTGYGWQKFRDSTLYATSPTQWSQSINRRLPNIRLADVYLMYAEAVNEAYGCNISPSAVDPAQTINVAAWEAIKAVRDRVHLPDGSSLPLPSHMYATDAAMRETIRRERAVELAFEGHRWYDLRRWYVADQPEYMRMDVLDFDKAHTYYKIRPIATKVFQKKHFWFPLKDSQTQIYSAFGQNPGW